MYVAHELFDRIPAVQVMHLVRGLGHEVVDQRELPESASLPFVAFDLVIAIVSARSNQVNFQLGIVATLGKEVLLIARTREDVVSGAGAFPCVIIGETPDSFPEDEVRLAVERATASRNSKVHALTPTRANVVSWNKDVENAVAKWFQDHGATVEQEKSLAGRHADLVATFPTRGVVVIEVRAWPPQGKVSVEPILQLRSFMSSMNATLGLLVTTGGTTRAAEELAHREGVMVSTVDELLQSGSFDEVIAKASRRDSDKA